MQLKVVIPGDRYGAEENLKLSLDEVSERVLDSNTLVDLINLRVEDIAFYDAYIDDSSWLKKLDNAIRAAIENELERQERLKESEL